MTLLVLLAVFSCAAPVHAQSRASRARLELKEEHAAIEAQSRHATELYIASTSLVFGGGAIFVGGGALALASYDGGGLGAGIVIASIGGIAAGIGLIVFIAAIVNDVGSGIRRGRYERRLNEDVTISLRPGGIALSF